MHTLWTTDHQRPTPATQPAPPPLPAPLPGCTSQGSTPQLVGSARRFMGPNRPPRGLTPETGTPEPAGPGDRVGVVGGERRVGLVGRERRVGLVGRERRVGL